MTRSLSRTMLARLLGASLAAATLAGCPSPTEPTGFFVEDFEQLCEDTPCGWTQIGGPDGDALYIETLPGDHGLQLRGDENVTVRGAPTRELAPVAVFSTLAVRAVARCDLTAFLEVRATLEVSGGAIVTFDGALTPDIRWSQVMRDQPLGTVDPIDGTFTITRVVGVSVRKSGPGSCELDYLELRTAF